jgi:NADPH:quinone reductase-like Zn-dependent oxidoreductase
VITTCSPVNFEYVKSLGADYVYDYNDPDCVRKIRRDNPMITLAYETGNENEGWAVVEKSFSLSGGRAAVNKYPSLGCSRDDVQMQHVASFICFGQRFSLGPYDLPDMPDEFDWAKKWWTLATKLVAEGKIKPHRPIVREGGLGGVLQGLNDMRQQKIRGYKLVYRM